MVTRRKINIDLEVDEGKMSHPEKSKVIMYLNNHNLVYKLFKCDAAFSKF